MFSVKDSVEPRAYFKVRFGQHFQGLCTNSTFSVREFQF